MTALTGLEQVSVLGQTAVGGPSPDAFLTTTQAIANLGGGGGGITGSTWDMKVTGSLAPDYDAQIAVNGTGTIDALGILSFTATFSDFYTYDGTKQFRIGSSPDATQVWEVRGGSTGVGPVLYATGAVNLNVVGNFVAQGATGGFYFGNFSGPILLLQQPEANAINYLEIWSRASGNPVTFQLAGGNTDVNGLFNAQASGGWFWANSSFGNIAFFGNATGVSTDYLRFTPQVSTSTYNNTISGQSGGDVAIGGQGASGGGVILTTATKGFIRIPSCAGAPTGVPAITDGYTALVFDTTDNKLYAYIGGAWKASGAFS